VVLYASYFDASGDSDTYPFFTVAGAGTTSTKWDKFEREWSAILNREGVSEFHATDFASFQGEYKGKEWKEKGKRSRFLRDLIAVIKRRTNKLFTVTVEMGDWRLVNKSYALEEFFFSPYALAGMAGVEQTIVWAKNRKTKNADLLVAFEDGDQGWEGLNNLCIKYLKVEPIRLPKSKACAFQVGDMLAWKTRITATNIIPRVKSLGAYSPEVELEVKQLQKEFESLDNLMVRPAIQGVLNETSLIKNCKKFGVPARR
jgi:hypothetical protein